MATADTPASKGAHWFATTRWSLVLAAGRESTAGSARALDELCSQYWYPLYAFTRRRGYNREEARDLTQAFFAKFLANRDLRLADESRGRFRTFLLSSLKNFIAGEWRKNNALKRGGDIDLLPLDYDAAEESYRLEPSHGLTPEAIYERRWALGLLERAVDELGEQYRQDGKAELFEALKGALDGGQAEISYADLSQRLALSEGALRTAVSRLRSRWRQQIRELVAETVSRESDVQDELRTLIASFEIRL